MGQEASVPIDDDLEEQAKAPPSTTTQPQQKGRRILNAVLHPRGQAQEQQVYAAAETPDHHDSAPPVSPTNSVSQYFNQVPESTTTTTTQPVVGVMYEKTPPTKKTLFAGRTGARGAALIHSMKNLNIMGGRKKEEKNWEEQWDADDDESEDEEDREYMASTTTTTKPMHEMRMDVGHAKTPFDTLEAQQLASPSVAAVPTSPMRNKGIVTPDLEASDDSIPIPVTDDDGIEWDTGTTAEDSQKPTVQMFMPMLRVLGKGSFGKVVLVQKQVGKERGQLFAMKILRKTHLVKRRQIERTRTERKVLSIVNHPFIMKLHFAFQSDDRLYLVLDYCPGGELFFHLSRFRRFPERVARFFAAELLLAIGHLHKRGIIYRDLKPENVLLDADGHVKLGDFGLAKSGVAHPYEGNFSMVGTPEYMAPEILAQSGHGFCVDYWGLGMLVYEMMTGLPPWYTTDRSKLFKRLKSAPLDIPSYFSQPSAQYVSALLERNPRRRLGVSGIRPAMEHEFFRSINWKALYAKKIEPPIRPCEGWKAPDAIPDETEPNTNLPIVQDELKAMDSQYLEAAVANFDNQFTRMPVESEDAAKEHLGDEEEEELNSNTFVGFTFDGKDPHPVTANARQRATFQNTPEEHHID